MQHHQIQHTTTQHGVVRDGASQAKSRRLPRRGRRGMSAALIVVTGAGVAVTLSAGSADAMPQLPVPPGAVQTSLALQASSAVQPTRVRPDDGVPMVARDTVTRAAARPRSGARRPGSVLPVVRATHNWAGYLREQGATREVSATWRIPRIAASPGGHASTWVGIDGVSNRYLTQVGVGQSAENGRTRTYAWWEVITPADLQPEQPLQLAVRPGDVVHASVSVGRGRTILLLRNATTGRSARHVATYAGPATSAEWIQEDVQAGGRISPAPAWSTVTFSHLTRNSAAPSLRRTEAVDIVDAKGVRETETSLPTRRGDGFSVRRLAAGHWGNLS